MKVPVALHAWTFLRQGPDIVLSGLLDGQTHVSGLVLDVDLAGGTAVALGGRYRLSGDPSHESVDPAEAAAEVAGRRRAEIAAANAALYGIIVDDGDD